MHASGNSQQTPTSSGFQSIFSEELSLRAESVQDVFLPFVIQRAHMSTSSTLKGREIG